LRRFRKTVISGGRQELDLLIFRNSMQCRTRFLYNTPCLKKLCQPILCSVFVKHKQSSIKIGTHVLGYTRNKLCTKCLLYLKYVLALPWEICSDRFNRQRSTYMHILINHPIATSTSGSHCLENC